MSDLKGLSYEELKQIASGEAFKPAAAAAEPEGSELAGLSYDELKSIADGSAFGPEKTSAGKAALIGAQDAATFGGRAAVAGWAEGKGAGLNAFFNALPGTPLLERVKLAAKTEHDTYRSGRQSALAEQQKAEHDQPTASIAGNVAGTITTLPIALGRGIKGAATAGGLTGFATSASEGRDIKDTALYTAGGAAGGAALGKLGQTVAGKLSSKGLASTANKHAFLSLGPNARTAELSRKQIDKIGRTLMDQGIISGNPKGYERIVNEVAEKTAHWGEELGKAIDVLDDVAVKRGIEAHGVSMATVADEALAAVTRKTNLPGARGFNERARLYLQEYLLGNEPHTTIKAAEETKRALAKEIPWRLLKEKGPEALTDTQRIDLALHDAILNNAEKTALNLAGIAEKSKSAAFKNAKEIYGALREGHKIVIKKEGQEFARGILNPGFGGIVGGAAGFASGDDIESRLKNMIIGGAIGMATKGARQYGPQVSAKSARGLSKFLKLGEKTAAKAGVRPELVKRTAIFAATPNSGGRRAVANEE